MGVGNTAIFGLVTSIFGAVFVVLALIAAAFLLRAYTRTRMSALLWMLLAVVVWPILTRIMFALTPYLVQSRALPIHDYLTLNLLEVGISSLVSGCLLAVSCFLLDRQLTGRLQTIGSTAYPMPAAAQSAFLPYDQGRTQ